MSNGAELGVRVTLEGLNTAVKDLQDLGKQFDNTANDAKKMVEDLGSVQKTVQNMADGFKDVGKFFTKYVTTPIMAGTGYLLREFSNLEYAIEKIGTLTSDAFNMDQYTGELLDLSRLTGVSAPDLSELVYTGLTASVPEDQIMDFTMIGHMLATGGFTNEVQAIDVLTTAMNAYGYEVSDAMHLSDLLISTQDRGKTTVDQLSRALGDVIPIASDNGLSFEQLSASMALLTKNGIGTARASTYIRSMLNELGRSGSRSDEALRELSGKGFRGLMEEGYTLADVLAMLNGHAEDNGLTLQDMFGNIRGGTGAMSLLTNEGEDLVELIDFMGDVSGRTDDNFEAMSNTMQYRLRQAFNDIRTSGYEVALALAPIWESFADIMSDVAEKVRELADWFTELDGETQKQIVTWVGLAAVIGPLLLALSTVFAIMAKGIGVIKGLTKFFLVAEDGVYGFGKTIKGIKTVFKGLWGLIKAFGGFLMKGVKLVIGAIKGLIVIVKGLFALIWAHPFVAIAVAVVAVVTTIIMNWEKLEPIFRAVWEKIVEVFNRVIDRLANDLETAKNWLLGIWESTVEGFDSLMQWFSDIWNGVVEWFTEGVDYLGEQWEKGWTTMSTFFSELWDTVISILSTAWETIKAVFTVAWLWIVESIRFAGELFLAPWTFIWVNFGDYLKEAWDWIVGILTDVIDWLTGHLSTAWNFIKDEAIDIWNTLIDELTAIWTWISELASVIWTGISDFFSEIWNVVSETFMTAWDWIAGKANEIWTSISTFFRETWTAVWEVAKDIWGRISNFFSEIWQSISNKAREIWDEIVRLLLEAWESVRSNAVSVFTAIWDIIVNVWEGIKGTTSRVWETIKSILSGIWNGIKSVGTTIFNTIKDTITQAWDSISSTTSRIWNTIKDTITSTIESARKAVRNTIDRLKSYFDFEWSLPKLKLPRISMKGKFSLTPPSVPSFGLDWYATGGIATAPSVVGIGEAGDEAILPLSNKKRMRPFAEAVSSMMTNNGSGNGSDSGYTSNSRVENLLEQLLNKNQTIVLDTGALIGATYPQYDREGGSTTQLRERWSR